MLVVLPAVAIFDVKPFSMENRILSSSLTRSREDSVAFDLFPIVDDFFQQYEIGECENEIWNLLSGAFSRFDIEFKDPKCISDSIFFCKNITQLLKGLNNAWKQQQKPTET